MHTIITRKIDYVFADRLKMPFRFSAEKLANDLSVLNKIEWTEHFVKQNYEGDWSAIPLRSPIGETHPIRMIYSDPSATEFVDTEYLKQCPYFQEVLSAFKCDVNVVRLMKLAAGSIIKEHSDYDLCYEDGAIRFHIPVVTNPEIEFYLNNERIILNAGECWYLRLSDPHRVNNFSTEDRIHLVVDATVNDWVTEIFKEASKI
jgi:quercetin dioxygenase-like cupin family protein